jgi:8-oxo-dGTP diphosphatase
VHSPNAHLTTDIIAIAIAIDSTGTEHVLLIERGHDPYAGRLALPGGYVDEGETFAQAAIRELAEETGLTVTIETMHRLDVRDQPDRDPRGRVISVPYLMVLRDLEGLPALTAGDDAAAARWVPRAELAGIGELAFDHGEILHGALFEFDYFTDF